jgi:predicted XRE-type DNA-binding protein
MKTNTFTEVLSTINDAEDAASRASSALQMAREEMVERFSPWQVGETATQTIGGVKVTIKVTNVQVAKSGRHGHKFVATGDRITDDGVETAERMTLEAEINESLADRAAPATRKGTKGAASKAK